MNSLTVSQGGIVQYSTVQKVNDPVQIVNLFFRLYKSIPPAIFRFAFVHILHTYNWSYISWFTYSLSCSESSTVFTSLKLWIKDEFNFYFGAWKTLFFSRLWWWDGVLIILTSPFTYALHIWYTKRDLNLLSGILFSSAVFYMLWSLADGREG